MPVITADRSRCADMHRLEDVSVFILPASYHALFSFSVLKMSAEVDVKLDDFKNIFSLNGKVAVVTGGSRGLGLHAASGYLIPAISVYERMLTLLPAYSKRASPKSSSLPAKPKPAKKPAPPSMHSPSLAKPSLSRPILRSPMKSIG
jgi:hypothetical protein